MIKTYNDIIAEADKRNSGPWIGGSLARFYKFDSPNYMEAKRLLYEILDLHVKTSFADADDEFIYRSRGCFGGAIPRSY